MKREKVNPLRGPEPLQPEARPVNTFYQVQQEAVAKPDLGKASNLANLANSLKTFSPYLDSLMQRNILLDGENKKAQAKALAETWANQNRESWNEFGKSHPEVRKYSPWLPYYYDQVQLKNLRQQLNQELDYELDNNGELRDARDPRTFDKFFNGYVNKFVDNHLRDKGYDERVLPSFYEDFGTLRMGLQKKYTDVIAKRNLEAAKQVTTSNVHNSIAQYQEGMKKSEFKIRANYSEKILNASKTIRNEDTLLSTTKSLLEAEKKEVRQVRKDNLKNLTDSINGLMTEGIKNNLSGTDINELVTNSILSSAESASSDEAFEDTVSLLEDINTGFGSLMSIGDTAGKVQRLRQRRVEIANSAEQRKYTAQKRAREERLNRTEADALGALVNDDISRMESIRDTLIKDKEGAGAAKIQALIEHAKELQEKGDSDADAQHLIDASDPDAPIESLLGKKNVSRSVHKQAVGMKLQQRKEAANKAEAAKISSMKSIHTSALNNIDAELTPDINISIDEAKHKQNRNKAKSEFVQTVSIWKQEHPQATLGEYIEFTNKTKADIIKRYGTKPSVQPKASPVAPVKPQKKSSTSSLPKTFQSKQQVLQQQQAAILQLQQQLNSLKGKK